MKSLLKSLSATLLRLIPNRIGSAFMSLLQSNRDIPDAWGVHVRRIQYYEPLPDFREITPAQTRTRRHSLAISLDLEAQVSLQFELASKYSAELAVLARTPEASGGYPFENDYFSALDAAIYYATIRQLKPRHVVEIGCGFSTRIADKALRANRAEGFAGKLTCIEPFPTSRLMDYDLDMELIEQRIQDVSLELFRGLDENCILFIDSSHAVKFQSDVCREFLEILPEIGVGSWVHVHDIFFPTDYPAAWVVEQRVAFNEQYLLEAFLAYNSAFESKIALRWLWLDHQDRLRAMWPREVLPTGDLGATSFWMRREQ